ncbi:MAG TPA: hypothetical protein VMW58_09465 [Anaerolineae bacterium]|nr:hypothetical protein [Anaerolineae bacterium]
MMEKKLPPLIEAVLIRYTGLCPQCKRYLDDHDLLKGKPVCPEVAATWAAIAKASDSKNTGFRASKRQGGR